MAGGTLTQNQFRIRNDDGTEATATWKAAQNVNPASLIPGTKFRLRFAMHCTGGSFANFLPTLWCKKNSGSYFQVTNASTIVNAVASGGGSADGTGLTNQLTDAGYTYMAGGVLDTVNGQGNTISTITPSYFVECEFCLIVPDNGNIVNNDVLYFEVYNNTSISNMVFSAIPAIPFVRLSMPKLSNALLSGGLMSPLVNSLGGSL